MCTGLLAQPPGLWSRGLKENVILGTLLPASTGLTRYRNVTTEPTVTIEPTEPTEEAKAALYALPDYQAYHYPVFGPGRGEVR